VGGIVDDAIGVPGCDRVDDLPVGENCTLPILKSGKILIFTIFRQ